MKQCKSQKTDYFCKNKEEKQLTMKQLSIIISPFCGAFSNGLLQTLHCYSPTKLQSRRKRRKSNRAVSHEDMCICHHAITKSGSRFPNRCGQTFVSSFLGICKSYQQKCQEAYTSSCVITWNIKERHKTGN